MNLEEVHKDFETLKILNERVMMKDSITKTFDELSIFLKLSKRILKTSLNCKKWKIYLLSI